MAVRDDAVHFSVNDEARKAQPLKHFEAAPIHGKILAVDPETDIVVISVGANAHVAKGMKLNAYREDKLVGRIVIISVFQDMSSARIVKEMTRQELKPGDSVKDGLKADQ